MRSRRAAGALLLTLVLLAPAARADDDPWLGRDKALHFGVSASLAAGTYGVTAAAGGTRGLSLGLGAGVAAAAGIGKETLDLAGYGDPSWKDLAWDAIGLVVGLAVAFGVDLAVRGAPADRPLLGARF